jgi:Coenzyme PQQ synthesis protein D (PqqD)
MGQTMSLDEKLEAPEDILQQVLGDELVLVNLSDGSHFGLQSVGRHTWDLVLEHHRLREVLSALETEYDVRPEVLERDLLRLADQLVSAGLLRVVPNP